MDESGVIDSGDEKESSGLSPTEFETLRLCIHTGDTERLTEGQLEEVTIETMTEDLENPHGDDVTDDPLLSDSEAEGELVPGPETEQTHCRLIRTLRSPNVLCYDQLGNPSYHLCTASSIQEPTANIVSGQLMYCPPCSPRLIATPCYNYGSQSLHWGACGYRPIHPHAVAGSPPYIFQWMPVPAC